MKYLGPIKTKKQAMHLADKLESGYLQTQKDAGKHLRRNWEYYAARPYKATQLIALANTDSMDVERSGSIMNRIING